MSKKRPDFSPIRVPKEIPQEEVDQLLKESSSQGVLDTPSPRSSGTASAYGSTSISNSSSSPSPKSTVSSLSKETIEEAESLLREATTAHMGPSRSLKRGNKPEAIRIPLKER